MCADVPTGTKQRALGELAAACASFGRVADALEAGKRGTDEFAAASARLMRATLQVERALVQARLSTMYDDDLLYAEALRYVRDGEHRIERAIDAYWAMATQLGAEDQARIETMILRAEDHHAELSADLEMGVDASDLAARERISRSVADFVYGTSTLAAGLPRSSR